MPLPALLPSASVDPIARRVRSLSSRTLCCPDPGRLALSMFLRAYIEFLISLQLSLPWEQVNVTKLAKLRLQVPSQVGTNAAQ